MRKSNFKLILMALVFSVPLFANSSANEKPEKEYELNYTESFSINNDALILFDTKHGNVNIKEGSSNKAVFEITISTDADSQEEADEIFDAIQIHFDDSKSSLSVETDFDFDSRKNKSWWENIFGGWNQSVSFQIDMEVTLPNTVALEIDHAFGDVYIPNMKNEIEVDIKHGNGRFSDIDADADIQIRHGKIKMGNVHNMDVECHHSDFYMGTAQDVDIEMSHSDLEIDGAENLELDARHCDVSMGKINKIITDSGHSDFEIDEVNYANFESSFGDIDIEWIGHEGRFDLQHGSVDIDEVSQDANLIEVDGAHSGVYLDVQQAFKLDYEGSHVRPNIKADMDYTEKDDEGNTYRYRGSSGANPKLNLVIDLQHGSFKLYD